MSKILMKIFLVVAVMVASSQIWAQCGVTMSCGTNTTSPIGTPTTPRVCEVQACFASASALQQYEKENSCKFASDALCGDKPLDKSTQCCGKDANSDKAKTKDRQITALDSKFDWDIYKKECPAMRQSEAVPDGLWAACAVGQKHSASDDWPVTEVINFPGKPNARTFCVDGCSTPPANVKQLAISGVFIFADKDNPTGAGPNGFGSGSSFYGSCGAHDVCYQACNASVDQKNCDDRLLANMQSVCLTIPIQHETTFKNNLGFDDTENTRDKCNAAARAMWTGLRSPLEASKAAFKMRRQQYCQCC